ncbi:hypothetical protein [Bacillus sp. FJAT-27245]|uniref:hypothetical protein n=1 Tax=Bacillus sp. FJAT-27245 TaxID=1684144 RepID=UPI0006A77E2A|nr:hypothetical protein [Bacillus sp. FJAT-27245]
MLYIITISALLVSACLYLVIAPFFGGDRLAATAETEKGLELKQVYEAVNEFEMDVLMNKISAEDFNILKESYYRLAAETIEEKREVDEDIRKALAFIRSKANTADAGQ